MSAETPAPRQRGAEAEAGDPQGGWAKAVPKEEAVVTPCACALATLGRVLAQAKAPSRAQATLYPAARGLQALLRVSWPEAPAARFAGIR